MSRYSHFSSHGGNNFNQNNANIQYDRFGYPIKGSNEKQMANSYQNAFSSQGSQSLSSKQKSPPQNQNQTQNQNPNQIQNQNQNSFQKQSVQSGNQNRNRKNREKPREALHQTDILLLKQQLQWENLPLDDGPKTLFIGDIPHHITTDTEYQSFLRLHELNIDPVKLKFIEQSHYGFATFKEHQEACQVRDMLIDRYGAVSGGNVPNASNSSNPQGANTTSTTSSGKFRVNWATNMDDLAKGRGFYLFLKNIPFVVTDFMLERFFRLRYGDHVLKAKIVVEQETGASKGYGWVSFQSSKIRQQAFTEMHREYLGTKRIRVSLVVKRGQFTEHEDNTEESDRKEEKALSVEIKDRTVGIEGLNPNISTRDIKGELLRHVPFEARKQLRQRQQIIEMFIQSEDKLMIFARFPTPEIAHHIVSRIHMSLFLRSFVKAHVTNMAVARYQVHAEKQWRQHFLSIHQHEFTMKQLFEKQKPENFQDNYLKVFNIAKSNANYAESEISTISLMDIDY